MERLSEELLTSVDEVSCRSQIRESINSTYEENDLQPLLIDYLSTSTSPETSKKQKPINFQVSKIIIGQWAYVAVYPNDIVAKFYLANKKLIWEITDPEDIGIDIARMKKKIEIQWKDVVSFRTLFHARDKTEILNVELREPPKFFQETNREAGKCTQWKQMDQDFTQNQSSTYRRHTLYFQPGILQENLKKLLSCNSFWSELIKVTFPLYQSICFNNSYESNNNSFSYNHGETLSFNDNNVNPFHHSQGTDKGNTHMATQFWYNDGRQINPYDQANALLDTEAITQSSQIINKNYNMINSSETSNLMNQDESGVQYMEEIPYPPVGSYLAEIVLRYDLEKNGLYI